MRQPVKCRHLTVSLSAGKGTILEDIVMGKNKVFHEYHFFQLCQFFHARDEAGRGG
jgi:hypothetical protein